MNFDLEVNNVVHQTLPVPRGCCVSCVYIVVPRPLVCGASRSIVVM